MMSKNKFFQQESVLIFTLFATCLTLFVFGISGTVD